MLISKTVFILIVIIAVWVVVAVAWTTMKILFTFGKDIRQSLLTVPAYLQERFVTFWSDGILLGLYRSFMFIFIMASIPLIIAFNIIEDVPSPYFASAYFVSYDGNRFNYETYVAYGEIVYANNVLPVKNNKVYIFNETNKTLILHDEEYSKSGGTRDSISEFSISPSSYLESNYKPDFWFGVPNKLSIKINIFDSPTDSLIMWAVESEDDWFKRKHSLFPNIIFK